VEAVFGYPRDLEAQYQLGAVLGAGSFGVVRRAVHRRTGAAYAIKSIAKIPRRGPCTPRHLLKLRTEVDVMRQLGPSLDAVYLAGAFEDAGAIHLVTELCEGGSLLDRLRGGGGAPGGGAPASTPPSTPLTEQAVARIASSVLRFLAQAHAKGIVYRDVKPDNFLFLTPDPNAPLRATDFGLAIRWSAEADDPPLQSRTGTPVYMAPEVVLQQYGAACDAWSAGVMIFQLLTGDLPFWRGDALASLTLQDVWAGVLHGSIDLENGAGARLPPGARDLLRGLLVRDPVERWTPAEALEKAAGWLGSGGEGGSVAFGTAAPATTELPLDASVVARLQRFATHGRLKQLILTRLAEDVIRSSSTGGSDGSEGESGSGRASRSSSSSSSSSRLSPSTPPPLPPRLAAAAAAVRSLFTAYDADGSGGIDVRELAAGLAARGYDVTPGEVSKLMSRLDADGDGSVSPAELAAGLVDWSGADCPPGVRADRGSGALSSGDGTECGCSGWAAAWADAAFDALDADGNGTIDLDELAALLPASERAQDGPALRAAAAELLREADTDGDGCVSRSEFEALLCEVGGADRLSLYDSRLAASPPAGGGGALRAVRGAE
jgi:calcium-dependent protein kinase